MNEASQLSVLQILWLTESRRIAFGVAARASMGSLITEAEICAYFKLFNKLAVMGTSVWRPFYIMTVVFTLDLSSCTTNTHHNPSCLLVLTHAVSPLNQCQTIQNGGGVVYQSQS